MSNLSNNNRSRQPGGTATNTVSEINVTAGGNGLQPPRSLALQNVGSFTLWYSTSNGADWNSIAPGGNYSWPPIDGNNVGIFEILVKTLDAGATTKYQTQAEY